MYTFFRKLKIGVVLAICLVVVATPAVLAVSAGTAFAATDPKASVCEGVGLAGGSCDPDASQSGPTVNSTVKLAVNILSFIVGVASVIMIMIGGFKYVISSGDSGNVQGAKNTILYAVIGLIVVALAQVIVRFVLNSTTPSGDETSHPTSLVIRRSES